MPKVATPEPGNEQRVRVSVITAVELDDDVSAGGTTCQSQGRHAGFGAGVHHTYHLQRRHDLRQQFRHLHLEIGGRHEAGAAIKDTAQGVDDDGWPMTEDHGSPGADVVDVSFAVGVGHMGTVSAGDEERITADSLESAHGAVDAAGDDPAGTFEEGSGNGEVRLMSGRTPVIAN